MKIYKANLGAGKVYIPQTSVKFSKNKITKKPIYLQRKTVLLEVSSIHGEKKSFCVYFDLAISHLDLPHKEHLKWNTICMEWWYSLRWVGVWIHRQHTIPGILCTDCIYCNHYCTVLTGLLYTQWLVILLWSELKSSLFHW